VPLLLDVNFKSLCVALEGKLWVINLADQADLIPDNFIDIQVVLGSLNLGDGRLAELSHLLLLKLLLHFPVDQLVHVVD